MFFSNFRSENECFWRGDLRCSGGDGTNTKGDANLAAVGRCSCPGLKMQPGTPVADSLHSGQPHEVPGTSIGVHLPDTRFRVLLHDVSNHFVAPTAQRIGSGSRNPEGILFSAG